MKQNTLVDFTKRKSGIKTPEQSEAQKLKTKVKFEKIKRKVQKYYPNAKTMIDTFSLKENRKKYYVVDENGYRIIPEDFKIDGQHTVLESWKMTWMFIVRDNIVRTNTEKFNRISVSDNLISKMYNQD
jgi:hypothetical protein